MKELIEKWCEKNGYSDIVFTENNRFCKANSRNTNLLILLKESPEDDYFKDDKYIYEFAYKNRRRQIWYVELKDGEIEWSLF